MSPGAYTGADPGADPGGPAIRRALITGGARRIGAAFTRELAGMGMAVAIHCNTSTAEADALAASLAAQGATARVLAADLNEEEACAGLIARAAAALGGTIDVLVNNASSFRFDDLAHADGQGWAFHLGTNLQAPVALARAMAQQSGAGSMAQQSCAGGITQQSCGGGVIVNMLDHKLFAPNADFFTYSIAKSGLAAATRLMAQALAPRLRVNAIAPGLTLISGKQTEAGFARAFAAAPLGRSSTPAELARALRLIVQTPSLNGEILTIDGGESLLPRGRDIAYAVGL